MIPLNQIDRVSLKCHRRRIFYECEKFYKDPENIKRFEEWKAAREAAAAKERTPSWQANGTQG